MNEKYENNNRSCDTIRELFDLLAAGDLPVDEAEFCHEHIGACPHCRAEFERILTTTEELRGALGVGAKIPGRPVDLWPAVQREIGRPGRRRTKSRRWNFEPVYVLAASAALTVALYVIVSINFSGKVGHLANAPVYESAPVVVFSAKIGERPARVSGFETGDGETVLLWLE